VKLTTRVLAHPVCLQYSKFCVVYVRTAAFSRCGKEMGLLLPFKCRKENEAMKNCMTSWSVAAISECVSCKIVSFRIYIILVYVYTVFQKKLTPFTILHDL